MENSELNKITNLVDLRQSENWEKFLQFLGWKVSRTSNGTAVATLKSFLGGVAKVQRPKKLTTKDLLEIDEICRREGMMFVKLEPVLDQEIGILEQARFVRSFHPLVPPSTIFFDLTKTTDQLWNAISRSGKYSIQRAKREGAKIEAYQNPSQEILQQFYEVSKDAAKAKGFIAPGLIDLRKKLEIFGNESFVIFVKDSNNHIMGGNLYVAFGECVWFLHGGTSSIGRKGKWGYELLWQSILHFKKQGFKFMDLEGRDDKRFPTFTKNWGGFSHFKEKFGGLSVEFPYPYIKLYSPILKLLKHVYGTMPL